MPFKLTTIAALSAAIVVLSGCIIVVDEDDDHDWNESRYEQADTEQGAA